MEAPGQLPSSPPLKSGPGDRRAYTERQCGVSSEVVASSAGRIFRDGGPSCTHDRATAGVRHETATAVRAYGWTLPWT